MPKLSSMMKNDIKKISTYIATNDSWMYLVVIMGMALIKTNNSPEDFSTSPLPLFFQLLLLYSPLLVFLFFKGPLQRRLTNKKYNLLLVLTFALNTLIVITTTQALLTLPDEVAVEFFTATGFALGFFILLHELHLLLRKTFKTFRWRKALRLEYAVLIMIFIWSAILGMMSVSNLKMYYEEALVNPSISFPEVANHFGLFCWISLQFFIIYLGGYVLFLINYRFLIPKLLKQKGILPYTMGMFGTVMLCYPLSGQIILWLPLSSDLNILASEENGQVFDLANGLIAFAIMLLSLPIILVVQWFEQNQAITSLEKEKTETELNLLKQQINPHFFFNTLNNLYALSRRKSDQTPEVILQLSDLMRYVIYKGREEKVSLSEEIKYLKDYLDLQKIRLHKPFEMSWSVDVPEHPITLPPLLFIVLVENAFKHGIEPAEGECFLHIDLKSDEKQLTFSCENSVESHEKRSAGIGLQNLKRRLALHYPGRHELVIKKENSKFNARLILKKL